GGAPFAARGALWRCGAAGRLAVCAAVRSVLLDARAALRNLRLDQILTTQEGVGAERARRVIEQILAVLEVPSGTTDAKDVTIGYILDSRAAGRRILATLEAFISHGLIGDAEELSVWRSE